MARDDDECLHVDLVVFVFFFYTRIRSVMHIISFFTLVWFFLWKTFNGYADAVFIFCLFSLYFPLRVFFFSSFFFLLYRFFDYSVCLLVLFFFFSFVFIFSTLS